MKLEILIQNKVVESRKKFGDGGKYGLGALYNSTTRIIATNYTSTYTQRCFTPVCILSVHVFNIKHKKWRHTDTTMMVHLLRFQMITLGAHPKSVDSHTYSERQKQYWPFPLLELSQMISGLTKRTQTQRWDTEWQTWLVKLAIKNINEKHRKSSSHTFYFINLMTIEGIYSPTTVRTQEFSVQARKRRHWLKQPRYCLGYICFHSFNKPVLRLYFVCISYFHLVCASSDQGNSIIYNNIINSSKLANPTPCGYLTIR